jgi:hypothetical protein
VVFTLILAATAHAQPSAPSPVRVPVEKIGDNRYRVGQLQVDTARREVTAPGNLNDITTVEFVANARGGAKAYESAMTLDTDAISFNTALLLIGLDPARAKPSRFQFDPIAPQGDPVDLFVELSGGTKPKRVRVEELLFDQGTKKTIAPGPWVYTGSTFVTTNDGQIFMAEADGVLIGLMHGPSALIDNPRNDVLGLRHAVVVALCR